MQHLEQLTPRATQIMDLAIQGLTSGDIAKRLGLSHPYICQIMGAANFQHSLAVRRERLEERLDDKITNAAVEAADVLKEHAVQAAKNLVAMADGNASPIALRANESVLDRVGVSRKVDGRGGAAAAAIVIIDNDTARVIQETLAIEEETDEPDA
jgi:predicted transcriptional regulator